MGPEGGFTEDERERLAAAGYRPVRLGASVLRFETAALVAAAHVISANPVAIQLRFLQTLTEVAAEKNSTLIFPVPIDIVEPLTKALKKHAGD